MLGNTASRELLKSSAAVTARSKATAEWNHNLFNSPRLYGAFYSSPGDQFCEQVVTGNKATNNSLRGSTVFKTVGGTPSYYSNSYNLTGLTYAFSIDSNNNKGFKFSASSGQIFRVTLYAKTSVAAADKIFVHFTEFNGDARLASGAASRAFKVDNVDWSFHQLEISVKNVNTNNIRVDFSAEDAGNYQVSDISVVRIGSNEANFSQSYRVKDTFSGFRPGDEIVEKGLNQKLSNCIYRANGTIASYSGGGTYTAGLDTLSYYMDPNPAGVYALYDKSISTNKIVIKTLNGSSSDSLYQNRIGSSYIFYTYSASTNTWTEYAGSTIGAINENGSLVLYWDSVNSTWSKTSSISQISTDGKSLSNVTQVDGIAFKVTSVLSSVSPQDRSVRILEVSPRLLLDLTEYIVDFSASKELDSGDVPLPVGTATANNASLSLENLPRLDSGSSFFSIFSDASSKTPLGNILKRDIKVRIKYDLINGSGVATETNIPFFTGYVDSWKVNDTTATLELFDYAKILQGKRSRDLLMLKDTSTDTSLHNILVQVFEQNGVSDYQLSSGLQNIQIGSFYADKQKNIWEIIQELILPYQYMAYVNNEGFLIITSYNDVASGSPVYKLTDIPVDGYLSNINEFVIEKKEKPSEIKVRYNTVTTRINATGVKDDYKTGEVNFKNAPEKVWGLKNDGLSLGYSRLARPVMSTDKEIYLDTSKWGLGVQTWTNFSGYLKINSEIIKYEGMKVNYSTGSGVSGTKIVKSQQEYIKLQSDILALRRSTSDDTLRIQKTGILCNLERGMLGTNAVDHQNITGSFPAFVPPAPDIPETQVVSDGVKVYSRVKKNKGIVRHSASPTNLKLDNHNGESVTRVESIKGKEYTMLASGGDKDAWNTYEFRFAFPKDRMAQATKANKLPNNVNDFAGVFMGVDPFTEKGIFIEFPLPKNTKKRKTAVYLNNSGTLVAKSKSYLDVYKKKTVTEQKATGKFKTVKVKKGKKTIKKKVPITKAVKVNTQEFDPGWITVVVKFKKKKISSVKVNNKTYKFNTRSSTTALWNGDVSKVKREGKAFGVIVGQDTHLFVASMKGSNANASEGGSTATQVASQPGNNPPAGAVTSGTAVYGAELFEVEYESGPAYGTAKINKPDGALSVKGKVKDSVVLIELNNSSTSIWPDAQFTPYRAKFLIVNEHENFIPISDFKDSTPLSISSDVLVPSNELEFSRKISDNSDSSTSISVSSKWIQSEENAKNLAAAIDKYIRLSYDTYHLEIFGNPLLEIGDVVNMYYYQSDITSDSKYIIIGKEEKFDGGFETSLTLRKITI